MGSGTIFPGLTTTATFQTNITFKGTVVLNLGMLSNELHISAATMECSLSAASDIAETIMVAQGHGMWMCINVPGGVTVDSSAGQPIPSPAIVTATCERFDYSRVGPIMITVLNGGAITVGSTTVNMIWNGAFLWVPTNSPGTVTTTYSQAGEVTILPALI